MFGLGDMNCFIQGFLIRERGADEGEVRRNSRDGTPDDAKTMQDSCFGHVHL